jgi:outer membrane protein assembly factor BamE (lipoprotein component of BamABCDE complex)
MNNPPIRAATSVSAFLFLRSGIWKVVFMLMLLSSCFVRSPKYSTLEQVMSLKLGMTKAQVEEALGVHPYDLKAYTDTSDVFIYVYRVTERRTISFRTKPENGKELLGKYVQLAVTYSKSGIVLSIESCSLCPDNLVTTSKIDFVEVLVFFTVTLPLLLLYFK